MCLDSLMCLDRTKGKTYHVEIPDEKVGLKPRYWRCQNLGKKRCCVVNQKRGLK